MGYKSGLSALLTQAPMVAIYHLLGELGEKRISADEGKALKEQLGREMKEAPL